MNEQPEDMYNSISAFFRALTELVKVFTKKVKEDSH